MPRRLDKPCGLSQFFYRSELHSFHGRASRAMSFRHFNGRNIGLDHDGIDLTDYGSYGTHKSNYKPVAASEDVEVSEVLSARPIVRRKPLSTSSTQRLIPEGIFDDATPTTLPRTLRRNTVANILTSLVLMALAVPFFTFAGFAWNLHGKPVTDQEEWDRLNEMGNKATNSAPTNSPKY